MVLSRGAGVVNQSFVDVRDSEILGNAARAEVEAERSARRALEGLVQGLKIGDWTRVRLVILREGC